MSQKCQLDDCAKTNVITDDNTGEVFCGDCGVILEERMNNHNDLQTHSLEEFMSQTRTGPKLSLTMHDRGLNSVIGNDKDSAGKPLNANTRSRFRRLRIWDSRSKTRSSSQRTLAKSLLFLNALKEKLGIPANTIEMTASMYRKSIKHGLTRGRSANSLMAASLYLCCRQTMIPRSLQDVAKVGDVSKKTLQKTVRTLIHELELTIPQYDKSSFVTKLSNNFRIKEKTKRYALKILQDVEKSGSSAGKHPIGQAAASLYLASILHDEYINQSEFAKMSGISSVTLRHRIKTIRKIVNL